MVVVCLFVVATSVFAADPMLRQLDYFAGQWKCSGVAFANPMAPEHATAATVKANWMMGGQWLAFTYAEKKTGVNPMPYSVSGFFGIDGHDKTLIIGAVDSMGGYNTGASKGWDGMTVTFDGPWHMTDGTVAGRDVFVKKSEKQMMHTALAEMDGKWVKLAEETCTR
jgi:hypothetical protein